MPGSQTSSRHSVVVLARQFFQALFAAFDGAAENSLRLRERPEGFANAGFVVYDQDARVLHARTSASIGNGGGNFDVEARAGGPIVFDADARAVFGKDVVHDGESQAGAAAFGGEVRQEQFFLVSGGDAAAGVGDQQLDGIGRGGLRARSTGA